MAQFTINELSETLGICPECLYEKLEHLGIDTFSSLNKMKQLIKFDEIIAGTEPVSFHQAWLYYCSAHHNSTLNEYLDDNEIEILDVI